MKIAITAATGSLGGACVTSLLKHPAHPEVIGISRNPAKIKDPLIEYRQGDYSDKSSYLNAFKGIDAVLLVSGMDEPSKRIQQHRNVIEAALESGVKKMVYTSIVGNAQEAGFSPVVSSNRQTEADIKQSGLIWCIGRNGLYMEPDIEYVEHYIAAGMIANCAGDGKCAYTTRESLARAYTEMLLGDVHHGQTYNLVGPAITQQELVDLFNGHFDLDLKFNSMRVEAYRTERQAELGDFMGQIIAGIYEGIRSGFAEVPSHYEQATGQPHIDWDTYFRAAARDWKSTT